MDPGQIATFRDGALVYFALIGSIALLPVAFLAIVLNLLVWHSQRQLRSALRGWQGELSRLQRRTRRLSQMMTRPLVVPLSLSAGISRAMRVWMGRR